MKKPVTRVSDHAVLRYLERVMGIDIETHRDRIGRMVDRAAAAGASGVTIDGFCFKLHEGTVITVRRASGPNIRLGRKPRRHGARHE